MGLMYRYSGVSQAEIGEVLGNLHYMAVSRERKQLRERVENDETVKPALEKIETSLMSWVKI
jgi:hypothetical protein